MRRQFQLVTTDHRLLFTLSFAAGRKTTRIKGPGRRHKFEHRLRPFGAFVSETAVELDALEELMMFVELKRFCPGISTSDFLVTKRIRAKRARAPNKLIKKEPSDADFFF